MNLLADDNLDGTIVNWLREQGHDVVEIVTAAPEASDRTVIRMSREQQRVLITLDSDIGRLLVADSRPHPGVIYLRLQGDGHSMWHTFKQVWPNVEPLAHGHFVTVTDRRIRTRPLPMDNDQ